jgi:hypothetical protein
LPRVSAGLEYQHLAPGRGKLSRTCGAHGATSHHDYVEAGAHRGPMKLFET